MSFPESILLSREQIITPTTVQHAPLGARGVTTDGRVYRYARAGGTNLSKGYLVQSAIPDLWSGATISYLSTTFYSTQAAGSGATSVSATVSSIVMFGTTGATATPADHFKEGYLWVNGASTECGQMVRIKGNTAASSGSTGTFILADEERFSEIVDTGSFISMQKNEYDAVIVTPIDLSAQPRGVPNCDVTAGDYFWLQTWGACPVKQSSVASLELRIMFNSTLVAGTVDSSTASTANMYITPSGASIPSTVFFKPIGESLTARTIGNDFNLVHLTLAP